MDCHHEMCGKCHSMKKVIIGALLLLNAFVWPRWTDLTGWISWLAVLMIIGGLLKSFKPTCGHCGTSMSVKPAKKSGKK